LEDFLIEAEEGFEQENAKLPIEGIENLALAPKPPRTRERAEPHRVM
jgi:hypothetical protein